MHYKLVVFVTEFGNYYYSISHPKARVIRSSNFAGCIGSEWRFYSLKEERKLLMISLKYFSTLYTYNWPDAWLSQTPVSVVTIVSGLYVLYAVRTLAS